MALCLGAEPRHYASGLNLHSLNKYLELLLCLSEAVLVLLVQSETVPNPLQSFFTAQLPHLTNICHNVVLTRRHHLRKGIIGMSWCF